VRAAAVRASGSRSRRSQSSATAGVDGTSGRTHGHALRTGRSPRPPRAAAGRARGRLSKRLLLVLSSRTDEAGTRDGSATAPATLGRRPGPSWKRRVAVSSPLSRCRPRSRSGSPSIESHRRGETRNLAPWRAQPGGSAVDVDPTYPSCARVGVPVWSPMRTEIARPRAPFEPPARPALLPARSERPRGRRHPGCRPRRRRVPRTRLGVRGDALQARLRRLQARRQ
jgi:hypothetical protein